MDERLSELTQRMRASAPPGRLTARYIRSLVAGCAGMQPAEFAASRRWVEATVIADTIKAAVGAHNRTDMAAALRTVGQDLGAAVRPLTIVGRLQGFRRVPAQIACVTQTASASAFWTDEGAAAPLSELAFVRETLTDIRLTGISVITRELALSASPAADEAIMRDLKGAVVAKQDETFIDWRNAGSPETMPSSVTRHARQFASSGSAIANIDSDLKLLLNSLSDSGSDLQAAAWVLHPRTAGYLASLRGSGGSPCYPGMGARGGLLLGLQALTSGSVPMIGSPPETSISLIDPSRIWLTESDDIDISVSTGVALEMSSAPVSNSVVPTAAASVSMFQVDSMAIKATMFSNWKAMTADSAASVLTGVTY